MEVKYIQNLTQDILDWKCVTVLNKHKINGKNGEVSKNSIVKGLHKFFKAIVNELRNALSNLG